MKFTREVNGIIYDSCLGRCYYCGAEQSPFGDWEIDHMTPRAQGGGDEFPNLTLACRNCNRRKGNQTVEGYRTSTHARALNAVTDAIEILEQYHTEPAGEVSGMGEELYEVATRLSHFRILFWGEANAIPRKLDPRFSTGATDGEQ